MLIIIISLLFGIFQPLWHNRSPSFRICIFPSDVPHSIPPEKPPPSN
nr:MAG TPA: hypothetical protein [Caudoviricetes sp.]